MEQQWVLIVQNVLPSPMTTLARHGTQEEKKGPGRAKDVAQILPSTHKPLVLFEQTYSFHLKEVEGSLLWGGPQPGNSVSGDPREHSPMCKG